MIRRFLAYARKKIQSKRSGKNVLPASTLDKTEAGVGEQQKDEEQAVKGRGQVGDGAVSDGGKKKIPRKRRPKKKWSIDQFQVIPEEGKTRFHDFDLPLPVMRGICSMGFQYCTAIQEKSLPPVLGCKDIIAQANTGTGKSAVFLVGIISRLLGRKYTKTSTARPYALILAPTRELVAQIAKDGRRIAHYTPVRIVPVYGGTDYRKQQDMMRTRCDIIVATPGRLLDFMGKKLVDLRRVELLVLDEADRMLDMGFVPDVRRIVGRIGKDKRQTMLFSATLNDEVKRLAYGLCSNPETVVAEPETVAVDTVEQRVYLVTEEEKYFIIYNLVKKFPGDRVMIFTNQKNESKRLADRMRRNGLYCHLLTGDVPQVKREKRLEDFRSGKTKILVATDVAGRGIHIDGVEYVINYTIPYEPEDYVHRIGRTGRAGKSGVSISFACEKGSFYIPAIEEYIGKKLECTLPEEHLVVPPPKRGKSSRSKKKKHNKSS